MKKAFTQIFILSCLFLTSGIAAQVSNSDMNIAIQSNLQEWLNKIPQGNEKNYGFNSRDEFKTAQTGTPLAVLSISGDFLKGSTANDQAIIITNEYRVPVTVNNVYATFLTVVLKDNQYQIVDLGGAILAKEVQANVANLTGNIYLLRVHQLYTDFLVETNVGNLEAARYYPLQSAVTVIGRLNNKLKNSYTQNEFFELIKEMNLLQK